MGFQKGGDGYQKNGIGFQKGGKAFQKCGMPPFWDLPHYQDPKPPIWDP